MKYQSLKVRLAIILFVVVLALAGEYRSKQRAAADDDRITTLTQWKFECSKLDGALLELGDDTHGCVPKKFLIFTRRLPKSR